jgi:hypothetical protein
LPVAFAGLCPQRDVHRQGVRFDFFSDDAGQLVLEAPILALEVGHGASTFSD